MPRTRPNKIRPLESVLNTIMASLRADAIVNGDDGFGRWSGTLAEAIGKAAGLERKELKRGSAYAGVSTYAAPLQWLKLVVPLRSGTGGAAARGPEGPRQSAYLVNMRRTVTKRDILDWRVYNSNRQRELREQRQREEHAAGDTPDTTTGGPVTTRHYHTEALDHPHGDRDGWHFHGPNTTGLVQPEGLDSMVIWQDADDGRTTRAIRRQEHEQAGSADVHKDVQRHQHGTRTGDHRHEGYQIVWVEHRHHTHPARTEQVPEPQPPNGVTQAEVRTDLAGGRQAILIRPADNDQRYRNLVDIVHELETKLAAAISREQAWEEKAKEVQAERDQYKAAWESSTDPSVDEADDVLRRYGKL